MFHQREYEPLNPSLEFVELTLLGTLKLASTNHVATVLDLFPTTLVVVSDPLWIMHKVASCTYIVDSQA